MLAQQQQQQLLLTTTTTTTTRCDATTIPTTLATVVITPNALRPPTARWLRVVADNPMSLSPYRPAMLTVHKYIRCELIIHRPVVPFGGRAHAKSFPDQSFPSCPP